VSVRWPNGADIAQLLDCEVQVWREGSYTARAVAGDRGQQLSDEIARETAEATEQLIDAIEPDE